MWLEQKNIKKAGDFDLMLINADLFRPDLSHNTIAYTRGQTDQFCSYSSEQDKINKSAGAKINKIGLEAHCLLYTHTHYLSKALYVFERSH